MSVFTLAISSLSISNLPWFMDLTFQVPMQYCSLQHQTLLLSPVTSPTGYCLCFGSISSFFLELFLHWSSVAYWAPIRPGEFMFQCPIFLPFHTVHGVFKARILKWFAIPFSSGPHFIRTLHHNLSVLGGPPSTVMWIKFCCCSHTNRRLSVIPSSKFYTHTNTHPTHLSIDTTVVLS